jgi:CubicO group peptidase (beta-lactamase class C family)
MRVTLLTFIAICILQTAGKTQNFQPSSLDTLLNRLSRHNKAMGSVLISRNGRIMYERGFGSAELNKRAASPSTIYRIGSISKTFTAALVFRLIEEGKLSLTDRLSKWYRQVPNADRITIDDLLSHNSGVHSLTDDAGFMDWQSARRSKAEIVAKIASYPPDFSPGEKSVYSNSNFILLGFIVEDVTGKPYAENLRARLTQPLALKRTALGGTINPKRGEALPYSIVNGAWTPDTPSNIAVAGGAGGIVSTVGDMAKFLDALFLRHYLNDSSLNKMKETRGRYGRGLMRFPFYSDYAIGHNGHIDNFSTSVCFFPKDSTVISVAVNALNYSFNDLLLGVLSIYYGKPYDMPDFERVVKVDAGPLKKMEGVYTCSQIGMEITIRATRTGLTAQATGQGAFALEPVSPTKFTNDGVGVSINFEENVDGMGEGFVLRQAGGRYPFIRKQQ